MNAQEGVRQQLELWRGILDQVLADCGDVVNKEAGGQTNTIGSALAHAVFADDVFVNAMIQGKAPLFQSAGWDVKTGVEFPRSPADLEACRN